MYPSKHTVIFEIKRLYRYALIPYLGTKNTRDDRRSAIANVFSIHV